MAKLKEGLANMAAGTQVNRGIRGEQFLSPNLSSDQKETMDRRSTHGMTDSLRVNQEPLLLYEVLDCGLLQLECCWVQRGGSGPACVPKVVVCPRIS
jgi:hypothetical protein